MAVNFNDIVSLDLKEYDKKVLWMICICTRFIQGNVLNDKNTGMRIESLNEAWN